MQQCVQNAAAHVEMLPYNVSLGLDLVREFSKLLSLVDIDTFNIVYINFMVTPCIKQC